jgi:formate hydrogenlyase subunit 4
MGLEILPKVLVFPGFLFTAVMGLLYLWFHRKLLARFQWRVGPPVYQTFADFIKLFFKETIIPAGCNRFVFISAPLLALASLIVASAIVPTAGVQPLGFTADLIVLVYLLTLPAAAMLIGGASSGNPFGGVGAGRKATLLISYELGMIVSLLSLAFGAGSLRLGEIMRFSERIGPLLCLPGAIAFLLCIQAKLGFIPFDIPEAKTEIMAGIYTEYSGVLLGLFKLSKAMLLFLLPSLMVSLFFPGPVTGVYLLDLFIHLAKVAVVVLIISVLVAANPRLRIDQALKFYWVYVLGLSALSFVLILYFA